jgi:hypothetical protein
MTTKNCVNTDKTNRNVSHGTQSPDWDSSNPGFHIYQEDTNTNINIASDPNSENYHTDRPTGIQMLRVHLNARKRILMKWVGAWRRYPWQCKLATARTIWTIWPTWPSKKQVAGGSTSATPTLAVLWLASDSQIPGLESRHWGRIAWQWCFSASDTHFWIFSIIFDSGKVFQVVFFHFPSDLVVKKATWLSYFPYVSCDPLVSGSFNVSS